MADPTLAKARRVLGEELFAQCDESDPDYHLHRRDLAEDRKDVAELEALRDKLRGQSVNADPSHPLELYWSLVAGTR